MWELYKTPLGPAAKDLNSKLSFIFYKSALALELLRCSSRGIAGWWSDWICRIMGSHGCCFIARIF